MALFNCATVYFVVLNLFFKYSYGIQFPNVYPRMKLDQKLDNTAGDPLFLTPYIKRGDIELAQNISRVTITEDIGFTSHSGFLTVNQKYNSNLYFWYFPPFYNKATAPVVLWLQGGPGATSLFGLFVENGPLVVTKDGFSLRKHHWALTSHLIYIDSPVGTGFTFTDSEEGYCKDQACVAKDLYSCLQQFFDLFPKLRNKDFYITGESYAGKYIPSLATEIHKRNVENNNPINLQGLAMGNAFCDPVNQMDYGNYLYQHGLLDDKQRDVFLKMQQKIINEINTKNWMAADILMDKLMDPQLTNFSYFHNYTGFKSYYNFLESDGMDLSLFFNMLHSDATRKSVHVGGLPFNSGEAVQIHLAEDILKSVASLISELLANYRIMFYNGQLDIIVAYPLTENFLCNLNFTSAEKYKTAPRKIWRVGTDIAGYYKQAGNLTEVMVRDSGHMVPHDQPKFALDLLTRFIRKKI